MMMTRSWKWALAMGAAVLVGLTAAVTANPSGAQATVTVYKSPTCGCCTKWVDHLRAAGFEVETADVNDLSGVKEHFGIDRSLESCHTGLVDGFVIEGHVPADLITRLLDERPDVRGLAVPGMPLGSPGMESSRPERYDVLALHEDGSTSVYAQR